MSLEHSKNEHNRIESVGHCGNIGKNLPGNTTAYPPFRPLINVPLLPHAKILSRERGVQISSENIEL
jgi:hypothetical protein